MSRGLHKDQKVENCPELSCLSVIFYSISKNKIKIVICEQTPVLILIIKKFHDKQNSES